MKWTLLLAASLSGLFAQAQLLAGEVPPGGMALQLGIELQLSTPFTADSAGLEIDCDDFPDIMAVLIHGYPPVDGPHAVLLRMIDDDLEICAEGIGYADRPEYHGFGEPLSCTSGFDWQLGDFTVLGDLGGFSSTGPFSMDSQYVAVRRNGLVGWILLSFDLTGNDVSLQVHEALSLCEAPSAMAEPPVAGLVITPTLTRGEPIRLWSSEPVIRAQVLDTQGRLLAQHDRPGETIDAPDAAGGYLIAVEYANGWKAFRRFVRD